MAFDPADAVTARALLERAVEMTVVPVLTSAEVTQLMDMAEADGEYTGAALNGAAATGWQWKAQKVTPNFSLSLEGGVKFDRAKVLEHCEQMRDAYLSGRASVIGTPRRRGTVASIALTAELPEVS